MGISTQGATNVSLNTAATYVGASPKSMRTVGGKHILDTMLELLLWVLCYKALACFKL